MRSLPVKATVSSQLAGLVLHLQRLSTEDGPGIRTTVFFKGCSLRCGWCHNPESIALRPQVQWLENRCIGCDTCLAVCPDHCLSRTAAGVVIDRACCAGCGTCARECPANALELLGTRVGIDELVSELVKDRVYYAKSGGGVTLSGGEPLMQPDFVAALLARLQAAGVHTALDTCGAGAPESLALVLPHTDLVLFDLKEIEPGRHAALTGQDNRRILRNLLSICDGLSDREQTLWIRTPLIPGATATLENIGGIGAFLAENLDGVVARWELCAFNNLCRDKYRRLGMDWQYAAVPLLSPDDLLMYENAARRSGVDPSIVVATGATAVSTD